MPRPFDLNEDVLKEPFNEEMRTLVHEFTALLKPVIETVDRFGLKTHFLKKHKVEHAIKAFASLRKVIEGYSTERGIRDYLVLLSVYQTCEYRGVDFFHFLRSGEKRVDDYVRKRHSQR